eukprot:6209295-Pleurochrysis_carterae.AAC.1
MSSASFLADASSTAALAARLCSNSLRRSEPRFSPGSYHEATVKLPAYMLFSTTIIDVIGHCQVMFMLRTAVKGVRTSINMLLTTTITDVIGHSRVMFMLRTAVQWSTNKYQRSHTVACDGDQ